MKIGNETVNNGNYKKLLAVKVHHELNFNEDATARRLARN